MDPESANAEERTSERVVLRPQKPKIVMFGVLAFLCLYFSP